MDRIEQKLRLAAYPWDMHNKPKIIMVPTLLIILGSTLQSVDNTGGFGKYHNGTAGRPYVRNNFNFTKCSH